jgi:hypothetical protein
MALLLITVGLFLLGCALVAGVDELFDRRDRRRRIQRLRERRRYLDSLEPKRWTP